MRIEHDIFDLIGNGGKYHSAILTCFSFDPVFFTSLYLPNLRAAGVKNIMVLVDASNYDEALEGYSGYGALVQDMKCHVVRMSPTSNGVFHPKVVLLLGKKDAFLAVGSGNLTYSGFLRNDEIWGAFQISGENSRNYPVLRQAWLYLNDIVPRNEAIECQLSWIRNNSICIKQAEQNADEFAVLEDSSHAFFVGNTKSASIFQQVRRMLSGEKVKAIKILSPFYDGDRLIGRLQEEFSPDTIHLVFDGSSPMPPNKTKTNWKAHLWDNGSRRLHGKAFQFECQGKNLFILGSANATCAAWGTTDSYDNDEVCIIIESDTPKDFFNELGIDLSCDTEVVSSGKDGFPEQGNAEHSTLCHILSCFAGTDSTVFLRLDSFVRDSEVVFMDGTCHAISSIPLTTESKEVTLHLDDISSSMIVELRRDNKPVSNRCLIFHSGTLQSMNPNDVNRKLEVLLESTPDWQGHIEEILSYGGYHSLRWDETTKPQGTVKGRTGTRSQKNDAVGTVTREDFDNILVDIALSPRVSANLKIADFLNATLKGSSIRIDDSDSYENISRKDIDTGLASSEDTNSGFSTRDKEMTVCDALARYCRRTVQLYDRALDRMAYNVAGIPEQTTYKATIEDYSILATIAISSFYCHVHSGEKLEFDWKNYTLAALSKFLVLFKSGHAEESEYSHKKSMEFFHDSVIYFLLVLSIYRWNSPASDIVLLLLNIIDALPDEGITTRNSLLRDYLDRVEKEELPYRKESVDVISKVFISYPNIESEIIELKEDEKKLLAYRNSIGYCIISTETRLRLSTGQNGGISASLHHPAFGKLAIITGNRIKVHHFR